MGNPYQYSGELDLDGKAYGLGTATNSKLNWEWTGTFADD